MTKEKLIDLLAVNPGSAIGSVNRVSVCFTLDRVDTQALLADRKTEGKLWEIINATFI